MAESQKNRRPAYNKKKADALREERRAAREAVLALLFETEYHEGEAPEAIYLRAAEVRDLDPEHSPVRTEYLGIMEHIAEIDTVIGRHAKGWKTGRLSRVSRAVLRLGVYELVYVEKIPAPIAINEAVELAKKFDDPKARAFINGVLNAVKNELEENGGVIPAPVSPVEMTAEIEAEIPTEEPDADPAVTVESAESAETAAEPAAEAE